MACSLLKLKEASFQIFTYGDKTFDPIKQVVLTYDDVYDCDEKITISIDKVAKIMESSPELCKHIECYYYNFERRPSHLEIWHIPIVLLVERFNFCHRYIMSYAAHTNNDNDKEIIIKYGHAPTWLLKRIL